MRAEGKAGERSGNKKLLLGEAGERSETDEGVFFRRPGCVLQPDPNDEITLIRLAGTFPQGKVKEAGNRLRAAGYAGKPCVPE